MTAPIPRLFTLRRDRDVSGVSGPGDVADGVQWADGTVALRWRAQPSTSLWDSLDLMLSVHGHDGATRVVWLYDATVSMTEHLEAANRAQLEIERLRGVAGRAYLLADRWQAAHGQSMFLVRAAGAELRDELDDERPQSSPPATQATDDQPAPGRPTSSCSNPDHACGACGDCAYEHPGEGGCPETPAHPAHIELVIQQAITADLRTENRALRAKADRLEPALIEQQRLADELGMSETAREQLNSERIEAAQLSHTFRNRAENAEASLARVRDLVGMWAPRLLPHSEAHLLLTDLRRALKGPARNVAAAVEVRDPCPYCEGCPLVPRTLMGDHVREHHPEVRTVEPDAPGGER